MQENIFEIIRNTITKDDFIRFLDATYGIEFPNGGNGFCPFHSHNHDTPSLGIKYGKDGAFFNCFACNTAGDIVKFVELKENISPLAAAKVVCEFFNIPCEISENLTDAQKAQREKRLEEIKKQSEAKRKELIKINAKKAEITAKNAAVLAPNLIRDFKNNYETLKDQLSQIFPFYFGKEFSTFAQNLIGYSFEHKSFVIIIRDENDNVLNLRYREKFIYDKKTKHLTSERMPGKWIGEANAKMTPFPLKYFLNHKDERVVLCEGEKDALNLLSYNLNCLTLGGVANSYENYKELLKNKIVYIWYDHDEAGYLNAIKRYYELKDSVKSVRIVLFYMIQKKLPQKYDISDYIDTHMNIMQNIWDTIEFAAFKPTNIIIDEICEYFPNLESKLKEFRQILPIKNFYEIKKEILAQDDDGNYINIFPTKGQLDDNKIDEILSAARNLDKKFGKEKYEILRNNYLQNFVIKENENENFELWCEKFKEAFSLTKTMRSDYHQTHIIDITESLLKTFDKLGYKFGEFKRELYLWIGSYYMKIDERSLVKFIQSHWMKPAFVDKKKRLCEVSNKVLENILSLALNLDEIKDNQTRRVINVLNGTIYISKNGVITFKNQHDYKDAATNILKFNFDKDAKCHKWDRFLSQIISDESDKLTLMEFIGYCFLPTHEFESFLFLYGKSGANGKSVILDTIRNFFGEDNISALQLQQFEGHQLTALTNKLINIGSEIDKAGTDRGQLANLKAIVSTKDNITINPKNEAPYLLTPSEKPKLAFAGNEKPKQGIDNGVFRRMLLISFDKEISDTQKIRGLSDRFNDELAGIFNQALVGLARLIKQNKFTKSQKMINELEEYKDDINPLRTFIKDMLIYDENYFIPNKYLYEVYKFYVSDKGGMPLKQKRFYQAIIDEFMMIGKKVKIERLRLNGVFDALSDRAHSVVGIKFSDDIDFSFITINNEQVFIENMSMELRKC